MREHAGSGEEIARRVCSQLLADEPRYSAWHAFHEIKMRNVADARLRHPQVLRLRAVAVQQVHRTALVNYLRLGRVTGLARDNALRMFHGVSDLRDATLAEHRNYLVAASTQVCARDLLALVDDHEGLALIRHYDLAYMQYFAMFCERAFALETGRNYLLGSLLPEVKDVADRLRLTILGSELSPMAPRLGGATVAKTASPARTPARRATPRARDPFAGPTASRPASRGAIIRTTR